MISKQTIIVVLSAVISQLLLFVPALAESVTANKQIDSPAAQYQQLVVRGISFLESSQADDGSWSKQSGPAITALTTTALLRHGRSTADPLVNKALSYLETFVQEDGGIYQSGTRYRNYETSLSVVCFAAANQTGKYDQLLEKADSLLGDIQWDESEDHDQSSPNYGGYGYGKHNRPDLSNTHIALDALYSLGKGPDDPRVQKALVFISRCQNLETPSNVTPFASKVNDGGFYYTPAAGGTSQAGVIANGGLRSYGSMTYAGFKSMIYAGVSQDDPRVEAALKWIQSNYTLAENPGMGQQGRFYYYHTFAKALDAAGLDQLVEANGTERNWREDLVAALAKTQHEDGSWTNPSSRWLEGDPNLVTAYCLLALAYCQAD